MKNLLRQLGWIRWRILFEVDELKKIPEKIKVQYKGYFRFKEYLKEHKENRLFHARMRDWFRATPLEFIQMERKNNFFRNLA